MSARRLEVRLQPAARRDVRSILLYTGERWGLVQRNEYRNALDLAFAALAENPHLGRPRDDVAPGLRSYAVGQHIIFYRSGGDGVIVLPHSARQDGRRVAPDRAVSTHDREGSCFLGAGRVGPFALLVNEARQCRRCPRMEGRRRLLGPENGALHPRVCFVAEAPGRLGGDRTAAPLAGDQSGRNFDRLLAAAGLRRDEVFITNAVLCNPRDAAGRNAPPTASELRNCAGFLAATLALLDPPIVVALGRVALGALRTIAPHRATLAGNAGDLLPWHGRWLVPLYHPSPRAQLHRSLARQMEDFARLGVLVRQCGDPPDWRRAAGEGDGA